MVNSQNEYHQSSVTHGTMVHPLGQHPTVNFGEDVATYEEVRVWHKIIYFIISVILYL